MSRYSCVVSGFHSYVCCEPYATQGKLSGGSFRDRSLAYLYSQIKTLPLGSGRASKWFGWLCANDVGGLKTFGALEQVELHGFAFV